MKKKISSLVVLIAMFFGGLSFVAPAANAVSCHREQRSSATHQTDVQSNYTRTTVYERVCGTGPHRYANVEYLRAYLHSDKCYAGYFGRLDSVTYTFHIPYGGAVANKFYSRSINVPCTKSGQGRWVKKDLNVYGVGGRVLVSNDEWSVRIRTHASHADDKVHTQYPRDLLH
jgi:hypothetical protein